MLRSFELAKTQLEVAYLYAKLSKLTNHDLALQAMSEWFNFSREKTAEVIGYCTGVKFPAAAAAHLYKALGFTYRDLAQLMNKSAPTISAYLNRTEPTLVMKPELTPFTQEEWELVRSALDRKRNEMRLFSFTAKESVF